MPGPEPTSTLLYERAWGDYDTDYVFPAAGAILLVGVALLVGGVRARRGGNTARATTAWLGFGGAFTLGAVVWLGWATLFGWTGAIAFDPPDTLVVKASGLLGQERRLPIDELARAHLFYDPIERGAPLRLIVIDRRGARHDLIKLYHDRGERLEPVVARLRGRVALSEAPPGAHREVSDGP